MAAGAQQLEVHAASPAARLRRRGGTGRQCARRSRCTVVAAASGVEEPTVALVGMGRVALSTARALLEEMPQAQLVIAGRSEQKFAAFVEQLSAGRTPPARRPLFRRVDVDDGADAVAPALQGAQLVVHTAGPFQRRPSNHVLAAAVAARVPYLDVSDDADFSTASRERFGAAAAQAGVPCVTAAGIFPGLSNVMAAATIAAAAAEGRTPTRLVYNYFTAGTGGAGDTILATSYLLAGEDATVVRDGVLSRVPPVSGRSVVDFGKPLGKRETFLYNLPEVTSARAVWGVPNAAARFGTSPGVWNNAMQAVAALVPRDKLKDVEFVRGLVAATAPLVRAVDALVGQAVGMRVDVDTVAPGQEASPKRVSCLYYHPQLSFSVGVATAAFAVCMLRGGAKPGVHWPEEDTAVADRGALLALAARGAKRFEVNKAAWTLDSQSKQLGFGFYWN